MTTILTSAGAAKFVGATITDVNGADISAATYTIGLGGYTTPPTTWVTPTVNVQGATTASRVVKLLVNNTTTAGTYWCWIKVSANPEIDPLLVPAQIVVA